MAQLYNKIFKSLMIASIFQFGVLNLVAEPFVRMNYGVGISNRLDDYTNNGFAPASKPKNANIYGANIGYKFKNNVLVDFGYKKFDNFKYTAIDSSKYFYTQNINLSTYTINAQYNFENNSKFFPFAKMGIGLSKNKLGKYNVMNLDDNSKIYILDSNASNNFTFNIGAGIGYKINDKWVTDFSYQHNNLGKIRNSSKVLENTMGDNIEPPISTFKVNSFNLGVSYYFN